MENFAQVNDEYTEYRPFLFGEGSCPKEYWRPYPSDNRYLISNMGRCFDTKRKRMIEPYTGKNNEYAYATWLFGDFTENKDEMRKNMKAVHAVVAETWVEKPDTEERLVVDHIDNVKRNNLAENLQYITYAENVRKEDAVMRKAMEQEKTNKHKKEINEKNKKIKELENKITALQAEIVKLKLQRENEKQSEIYKTQLEIYKRVINK